MTLEEAKKHAILRKAISELLAEGAVLTDIRIRLRARALSNAKFTASDLLSFKKANS